MRWSLALVPVLAAVSVLPVSGGGPRAALQEDTAPKSLRVQWDELPETIDPQFSYEGQWAISGLDYEGLTRFDEELNVIPAGAESWQFSDDGTMQTFRLRENLTYSDGTPLTAERFRFAVQRICDPLVGSASAVDVYDIVGCEDFFTSLDGLDADSPEGQAAYEAARKQLAVQAPDVRTLEIRLRQPARYFPGVASYWAFAPVREENIAAGGPEWWLDPATRIGNDPFRMVEIDQDGDPPRIAYIANEHYWGGRPRLDGFEHHLMDNEPALDAYKRGEIDIIWPSNEAALAIEADPVLSRELVTLPVSGTGHFPLNHTLAPFDDPKVRQAFAYAFDREAYCREVGFGWCDPVLSWAPAGAPGAIETDAFAFDPARARQALAESSYGGPNDLPEVEWYVVEDDPWSVTEGEWLASQFREVLGVELTLTPVDGETYDALWGDDPASFPRMGAFSWSVDNPDPHEWFSGFFTCGGAYYAARVGYCNPELDALLARADAETDPERRLALYEEAGHVLVADAPTIFVYTPTNITLVKPNVTGYSTDVPQEWPGWLTPLALDIALAE